MKTLKITVKAYNRGTISRETRETFVFPAETLRREGRGVGEVWMHGLRAVHYFLLRDGRVDSVRVRRTFSNASLHVTVNDNDDIGPIMYDIVHDLRACGFPV